MAVKRKVKAKAKPKRRKAPAKRPVARKTSPRAKSGARRAPAKRAARKPRRAVKAVPQAPSAPERPAPGERVGVVTHYYGEPRVAIVKLEAGTSLRVGDMIHIQGHTTDFAQRVESLQIEHAAVEQVGADDDFGLKVVEHAREHDVVYRLKQAR